MAKPLEASLYQTTDEDPQTPFEGRGRSQLIKHMLEFHKQPLAQICQRLNIKPATLVYYLTEMNQTMGCHPPILSRHAGRLYVDSVRWHQYADLLNQKRPSTQAKPRLPKTYIAKGITNQVYPESADTFRSITAAQATEFAINIQHLEQESQHEILSIIAARGEITGEKI